MLAAGANVSAAPVFAAPAPLVLAMAANAGQATGPPADRPNPKGPALALARADQRPSLAGPALAARDAAERRPPDASAIDTPPPTPDSPSTGALIGAALLALVWLQGRSRTA